MKIKTKPKSNTMMTQIYNSSIKFLAPLNLEQTYKVFIEEALKLSGGKYGSVILIKNNKFIRAYSSSPLLNTIKPRAKGYIYKSYKSKNPRILTLNQIERFHPEIKKAKIKYDVVIPLVNRNKSIGVFTILTQHKLTSDQFNALKLFSPLAALAVRKAQLYNDVQKAIESRDLFFSLASHELRTPITTSYVYLQLIERNLAKNKPLDRKWILRLKNETERLTAIINELLEVNQANSGKLSYNLEECNIDEIIQRALINFKAKYTNRIVKITNDLVKENKILIGDFNKLISVFINLLDNAAKHSNQKTLIKINLNSDKKYIVIAVTDHGTGIVQSDIGKIFDDFYKAKENTLPGMGLGLFLANQIVLKHKGDIVIESKLGEGTTVEIRLPYLKK